MHPLKKTAFASFTVGKENQKTGTGLEEILKQVGLPQSLGLNRKEGKTFFDADLSDPRWNGLSYPTGTSEQGVSAQ